MAKRKHPRHPSRRRLQDIDLIAQAQFSCPFGPADAYLRVLERAPHREQVDLVARMLVMHHNVHPNGRTDTRDVGNHEALNTYTHRYVTRIDRFRKQIRRGRFCLHHASVVLWRWLCGLSDRTRRLAALTLMLDQLTPLADVRHDLLCQEDRTVLAKIRNTFTVRQSIAEFQRLLREGQDAVDAAAVVLGLLNELPRESLRVTFLAEVLAHITRSGQRRSRVLVIPLVKIGPAQLPPETPANLPMVPEPSVN